MAHLFHRMHEQTYVAHVMGYAACIGPYLNCKRPLDDPRNEYYVSDDSSRHTAQKSFIMATAMLLLPLFYL